MVEGMVVTWFVYFLLRIYYGYVHQRAFEYEALDPVYVRVCVCVCMCAWICVCHVLCMCMCMWPLTYDPLHMVIRL